MNRIMVRKGIRSLVAHGRWAALGLLAIVFVAGALHSSAETPLTYNHIDNNATPQIAWHTDLKSGWAEAHRRNVPMVIFITSDRCHYCDAMKRDTWRHDSVRQQMAGRFVAIELKPGRNAQVLSKIDVPAYPTTMMGIPDGKIVAQRVGYQPPSDLLGLLAEAENYRGR